MEKWTLKLELRNNFGERYSVAVELDRECVFSGMTPMTRESIDLGISPFGFDDVVKMMKRREFRRDLLAKAAEQLSGQMGDFMEDKEGWHGRERADAAEKYPVRQS
jgi:hypothetical protein